MNAFTSEQPSNMGGNDTFWYVYDSMVERIPAREADTIKDDIVLTGMNMWKQGYATTGSLDILDSPELVDNGHKYPVRILFKLPKDQPGALALLFELSRRKHVVATRSMNKFIKIHGTKRQPLRFKYTVANPATADGFNGYLCEFYGTIDEPSWFYSGVITVDGQSFTSPSNPGTIYTVGGKWIFGSIPPINTLGNNGDGYFDYTTNLVYEKINNNWQQVGYLGPDQELEEYAFVMSSLLITGNIF